jgi:hypothetical protein
VNNQPEDTYFQGQLNFAVLGGQEEIHKQQIAGFVTLI